MPVRPMLAAQKYRKAGDLWGPIHEKVVQGHLASDEYLWMQPKIDGMRCCFSDGVARSRSWKPLANQALQKFAREHPEFDGVDCEVVSGHGYVDRSEGFRLSMSHIRSGDGSGDFTLVLFDVFLEDALKMRYSTRRMMLVALLSRLGQDNPEGELSIDNSGYRVRVILCPTIKVTSLDEIYQHETRFLADGFEGGIIRREVMGYKYNRGTALGGELVKVKRRDYVDAQVIGYEERLQNGNEAKTSELGFTVRSAHQENLAPTGMLGALLVRIVNGPLKGVEQKVGVFRGLTHSDLRDLWNARETLVSRYLEMSVDKAAGGYDLARCPVWIRWRSADEF